MTARLIVAAAFASAIYVLGVARDELGVEYVRLYGLERLGPAPSIRCLVL